MRKVRRLDKVPVNAFNEIFLKPIQKISAGTRFQCVRHMPRVILKCRTATLIVLTATAGPRRLLVAVPVASDPSVMWVRSASRRTSGAIRNLLKLSARSIRKISAGPSRR
jgi:hypothetical protein